MSRPGPLDAVHEWVLVLPRDWGPCIYRLHGSFRWMLDIMTRWVAASGTFPHATLWRQTRRGWQCEGNA